jgi:hypothetical protein
MEHFDLFLFDLDGTIIINYYIYLINQNIKNENKITSHEN